MTNLIKAEHQFTKAGCLKHNYRYRNRSQEKLVVYSLIDNFSYLYSIENNLKDSKDDLKILNAVTLPFLIGIIQLSLEQI